MDSGSFSPAERTRPPLTVAGLCSYPGSIVISFPDIGGPLLCAAQTLPGVRLEGQDQIFALHQEMRAQGAQAKEGHLEPGVAGGQDQQGQGQGQGPLSKWGMQIVCLCYFVRV